MNQQSILTDDLLEAMLVRRAGPGAPADLAASIAAEVAALSDGRRPWWSVLAPPAGRSPALRLAWIVALVGLLLAATVSAVFVGSQLLQRTNDPRVVTPPVDVESTDILATTRARPLPAQATCPPGSTPDAPGPADQVRPAAVDGAQALDRHAGRIVVLANDTQIGPRTWTFDVCTNTWQRMNPSREPGWNDPVTLVYDADSDRTVAFTRGGVWSYDLAADRWDPPSRVRAVNGIAGWAPGDRTAAVYHDPSGLVIVYDGHAMWAYDVETDTWTAVRQAPDPSRPADAGLPEGVTVVAYDRDRDLLLAAVAAPDHLRGNVVASGPYVGEARAWLAEDPLLAIWAFDPAAGLWRLEPSGVPAGVLWQRDGYFYGPVGRAAFDEASGATVFVHPSGWVEAFDGRRSRRASPADRSKVNGSDAICDSVDPLHDPINGRIVCQVGGGGVSAFTTATGQWRWLLEPGPEE